MKFGLIYTQIYLCFRLHPLPPGSVLGLTYSSPLPRFLPDGRSSLAEIGTKRVTERILSRGSDSGIAILHCKLEDFILARKVWRIILEFSSKFSENCKSSLTLKFFRKLRHSKIFWSQKASQNLENFSSTYRNFSKIYFCYLDRFHHII